MYILLKISDKCTKQTGQNQLIVLYYTNTILIHTYRRNEQSLTSKLKCFVIYFAERILNALGLTYLTNYIYTETKRFLRFEQNSQTILFKIFKTYF